MLYFLGHFQSSEKPPKELAVVTLFGRKADPNLPIHTALVTE